MTRKITYSENPNHRARAAHAKGDKAFRTYDVSAIKPKRSPVPAIIAIILLIVIIGAVLWGVSTWLRGCSSVELLEDGAQVEITVVEGEGAQSVAKTLMDAGLLENTNDFTGRMAALGDSAQLQPGVYTLTGGMSVDEIIATLQVSQQQEQDTLFTVPEGSTVSQVADIVAEASEGRIKAKAFRKAANNASKYAGDYEFLSDVGEASLEGYLFPKSYPITEDSTADSLIRAMLDQFRDETANLDYSYAESQGLSRYDVVKMASMIERETDQNHREDVASVFYNRLSIGMLLQSDATMAYALGREPTADDLLEWNDYNTYLVEGLPPTPICSPGIECLQAVCAPADTGYYYFYIAPDKDGKTQYAFNESYEAHEASVAELAANE